MPEYTFYTNIYIHIHTHTHTLSLGTERIMAYISDLHYLSSGISIITEHDLLWIQTKKT